MNLRLKSAFLKLALSLIAIAPILTHAQTSDSIGQQSIRKRNFVKLELVSIGASFDLSNSPSGNMDGDLLGTRQPVALSSAFRFTHLFSQKLGWYTALKLDYLNEKKSPYYSGIPVGEILLRVLHGGFVPSYSLEGGLLYRIEKGRWDIHPRLGFGYGLFLLDQDSEKNQKMDDGSLQQNIYTQRASGALLNVGLSSHYFFGRKSFISFNLDFRQPLSKAYGRLQTTIDGTTTVDRSYRDASIGRALQLVVGYGFTIGRRKL